jgi:hypothetical protein
LRFSTFRETFRVATLPLVAVVVLSACSNDSSSTSTTLDPPHLRIDSIQTVGGAEWTPGSPCLALGTDPAKTLSVNAGPTDGAGHLVSSSSPPVLWTIAPPQACTGTPPCGFLVLTMDSCTSMDPASCGADPASHAEIVSGARSIPVSMAMFPNPLGFFRFHIELFNQDATLAVDENGKHYPTEEVVEFTEQCGGGVPPPVTDSGTPPRDGGTIGPDTGPTEPTDSSVAPLPDASSHPESGTPPNDATTTRPDAKPAGDAHVPDAIAPGDSGAPIVPTDAAAAN